MLICSPITEIYMERVKLSYRIFVFGDHMKPERKEEIDALTQKRDLFRIRSCPDRNNVCYAHEKNPGNRKCEYLEADAKDRERIRENCLSEKKRIYDETENPLEHAKSDKRTTKDHLDDTLPINQPKRKSNGKIKLLQPTTPFKV